MKALLFVLIAVAGLATTPNAKAACVREECPLLVHVSIAEQLMYVYDNGELTGYQVSTGIDGFDTISFEGHPIAGRIYDAYTSKKFPGGNFIENGVALGNMPYAMFFEGGFAIHGTPENNFIRLGQQASHGCIRMYPEQAKKINRRLRELGTENVWFSIDRNRVGTAPDQR